MSTKGRPPVDSKIRFWSMVNKDGPVPKQCPERGKCWEWTGYFNRYCNIKVDGKQILVHRYSWLIHNGDVPAGLMVCHHCDNGKCVRPDHLFVGTGKQNMQDCKAKGRYKSNFGIGSNHINAKLKEPQDIWDIRRRAATGELQRIIAADYGISQTLVSLIHLRKRWKHIP